MSLKKILIITLFIILPVFSVMAQEDPDSVMPQEDTGIFAQIKTSKGSMLFRLDTENTPLASANFIGLAEGFFYNKARNGVPYFDGLLFYRVIKNYAVFSGDPLNNGSGGPGYTLPREKNQTLSAANPGTLMMSGLKHASHGSQFFIMCGSDSYLDQKYTPFGMIVKGMEVLNKITDDDVIESVTIIRIGEAANEFAKDGAAVSKIFKDKYESLLSEINTSNASLANQIESLGTIKQRTLSGIWFTVSQEGTGPKVNAGQVVLVHYQGKLLNGTVFDSSYERGQPLELAVGIQPMIPGWMEALMDMKKGEKRKVIIPPELAYGKKGYGPIGPDSWLVFDLELIDIR